MNKIIVTHHQHIDNGGVSISIEDRDDECGWFLILEASYYGYPSLKCELPLGNKCGFLGSQWLHDVGTMFIVAAEKLKSESLK